MLFMWSCVLTDVTQSTCLSPAHSVDNRRQATRSHLHAMLHLTTLHNSRRSFLLLRSSAHLLKCSARSLHSSARSSKFPRPPSPLIYPPDMSDDGFSSLIKKIRHEDDSEAHRILRSYLGNQVSSLVLTVQLTRSTSTLARRRTSCKWTRSTGGHGAPYRPSTILQLTIDPDARRQARRASSTAVTALQPMASATRATSGPTLGR